MFSCEFCVIFKNTHMVEHLRTAANEVANIETPTDPVHLKKVYSKTSIEQEMFGKKIFCGKCPSTVIGTNDGSSWMKVNFALQLF